MEDIKKALLFIDENRTRGDAVLSVTLSNNTSRTLVLKDGGVAEEYPWATLHYYEGVFVRTLEIEKSEEDGKNYLVVEAYSEEWGLRRVRKPVPLDRISSYGAYKWYLIYEDQAVGTERPMIVAVFVDFRHMKVKTYMREGLYSPRGKYMFLLGYTPDYRYITIMPRITEVKYYYNLSNGSVKSTRLGKATCPLMDDSDVTTSAMYTKGNRSVVTLTGPYGMCVWFLERTSEGRLRLAEKHYLQYGGLAPVGPDYAARIYPGYIVYAPPGALGPKAQSLPFYSSYRLLVIYKYTWNVTGPERAVFKRMPLQHEVTYYSSLPEMYRRIPPPISRPVINATITIPSSGDSLDLEIVGRAKARLKRPTFGGPIARVVPLGTIEGRLLLLSVEDTDWGGNYYIDLIDPVKNKTIYNSSINKLLGFASHEKRAIVKAYYYNQSSKRLIMLVYVEDLTTQGSDYGMLLDLRVNPDGAVIAGETNLSGLDKEDYAFVVENRATCSSPTGTTITIRATS